jgi:hypothetical protein
VRKLEYYQTREIEDFLVESGATPSGTVQYGDDQRNTQEAKALVPVDDRLEIWKFTGPIPGFMLTDWGLTDIDVSDDYNVEVLWSRGHILKVMPMWDETGVRPYFKAVFKLIPGSFWGIGVPELMSASQDRANMMMISLLDNTNWGTGTIAWIDESRLANPDDVREFHSKKLIATHSTPGQTGAPMGVLSFDLKVAELNSLYLQCLADADNESGVPAYMYGSGASGGAAGTYSGLATLMNAAARGIKDALLEIDQVLMKFVQHWADWNNAYSEDESIKGDIRVLCSGSTGLFVQEMMLDKLDNLIAQAQPFMNITGPSFVLGMIRQKANALKVDTTSLPTDEEIAAMSQDQEPAKPDMKPSVNISVKWEMLTPEEKSQIFGSIGIADAPGKTVEGEEVPALPVATTGTPANLPENTSVAQDQMGSSTGVPRVPPIKQQ